MKLQTNNNNNKRSQIIDGPYTTQNTRYLKIFNVISVHLDY